MSRSWIVTKARKIIYRSRRTEAGDRLSAHSVPCNPYKGAEDVGYEGLVMPDLPQGNQISISNRSGDRKKY